MLSKCLKQVENDFLMGNVHTLVNIKFSNYHILSSNHHMETSLSHFILIFLVVLSRVSFTLLTLCEQHFMSKISLLSHSLWMLTEVWCNGRCFAHQSILQSISGWHPKSKTIWSLETTRYLQNIISWEKKTTMVGPSKLTKVNKQLHHILVTKHILCLFAFDLGGGKPSNELSKISMKSITYNPKALMQHMEE